MLVKTWKSLNSGSFESRKCRTPLSNACLAVVSNLRPYVTSKPCNWRLWKWRMLSLGGDYPSSRCSNKNLCFDKKFMAGRWNVSLLMIKVSTVLDTNKQGFWTISTEMGTHWGLGTVQFMGIQFSSMYCQYIQGIWQVPVLRMDALSTTQGAQKVRSQPYRSEACIITKDLILGTALGPRFFYFTSFRIWYVQSSTKDRIWYVQSSTKDSIWQPLKSFHDRIQASVEGTGWEDPMTNNQAMTLRVNDGKEGHSNGEFTHRDRYGRHRRARAAQVGCLLPYILDDELPVPATPGPKKNFWFEGDSGGGLISFAETQKGMQCQSGQCLMNLRILLAEVSRMVLFTL